MVKLIRVNIRHLRNGMIRPSYVWEHEGQRYRCTMRVFTDVASALEIIGARLVAGDDLEWLAEQRGSQEKRSA